MTSQKKYPPISSLSKYLFWDTPQEKVTWDKNGKWLVARILQYGQVEDWELLREAYGIQGIAEIAITIRSLDPTAVSFISLLSGIPKEQFRCYKERQSNPTLWNS